MRPVAITMFYWGGEKFGVKIWSSCKECDINRGILEDMKQKEFKGRPIALEFKPWLTHFGEALSHGGWHAPVILVNGKLFSQGVVVDRKKLAERVSAVGDLDMPSFTGAATIWTFLFTRRLISMEILDLKNTAGSRRARACGTREKLVSLHRQ